MQYNPNIPYYYQIKEDILKKIENQVYSIGDQLASEIQLAEEYGVSRPTVRQAIAELVREGILVRGRGKGTFVSRPIITDNAQVFTTFSEPAQNSVENWAKLLSYQRLSATDQIAKDLNIQPGSEIHEIVTLRMNEEERLAIRTLQIPVSLAPDIKVPDLQNVSIYDILQKDYGLVTVGALQYFQSVMATEEEAAILEIEIGDSLTLWQGIVLAQHQTPIIRVKTLFRGDRFKFFIKQGKAEFDLDTVQPIGTGIIETWPVRTHME